jgi:hypothetical protein
MLLGDCITAQASERIQVEITRQYNVCNYGFVCSLSSESHYATPDYIHFGNVTQIKMESPHTIITPIIWNCDWECIVAIDQFEENHYLKMFSTCMVELFYPCVLNLSIFLY